MKESKSELDGASKEPESAREGGLEPPSGWRRLFAPIAGGIAGLFLCLLAAAYFGVPPLVERLLDQVLRESTQLRAETSRIRFNPFELRLEIEGARFFDARSEAAPEAGSRPALLEFDVLSVDVDALGSLGGDLSFDAIRLTVPRLFLSRDATGGLDWIEALQPPPDTGPTAKDEGEPLGIRIAALRIEDGTLSYREARSAGPPFETVLESLSLSVDRFSTRPADPGFPFVLSMDVPGGGQLEGTGEIDLEPLQSKGKLDLEGFALRLPWQYVAQDVRFEIESGRLDFETDYRFGIDSETKTGAGPERGEAPSRLDLEGARLSLADFSLLGSDRKPILELKRLLVAQTRARFDGSSLEALDIESIRLQGGRLAGRRESDGSIDWVALFAPDESTDAGSTADASSGVAADADAAAIASAEVAAPLPIRIGRFETQGLAVAFEDRVPEPPFELTLSPFDLQASGIDLAKGNPIDLELATKFADQGALQIRGPVRIEPLGVDLEVSVKELALAGFRPYWSPSANLDLRGGRMTADLKLDVEAGEAETGPRWSGLGRVQVDDLDAALPGGESLFSWRALRFEGLDFSNRSLALKELGLDGLRAAIEIDASGQANVSKVAVAAPAAPGVGSKTTAPGAAANDRVFGFRIDRVTLADAAVDLVDRSVAPIFRTSLDRLSGTVLGLANDRTAGGTSRARVELEGRIDERGPLSIRGEVDPIGKNAYADLSVEADGFSLPSLSSYTGRYVGYGIDRGNLGVRLDYKLKDRVLEAENRFFLERFSFGARDKEARQNSFPIPLPVAANLIKDLDGNIKVDLPIRGNLDDPKFSVLGLLSKSFINLLTRIATSPLSVLGSVLGAVGGDLSQVAFAPGVDQLGETERAAMVKLARALAERGNLGLGIRGRADPTVDGPVLGSEEGSPEARQEALRHLAERRADAIQTILLETAPEVGSERLFLEAIEVGDLGDPERVSSELTLSTR